MTIFGFSSNTSFFFIAADRRSLTVKKLDVCQNWRLGFFSFVYIFKETFGGLHFRGGANRPNECQQPEALAARHPRSRTNADSWWA